MALSTAESARSWSLMSYARFRFILVILLMRAPALASARPDSGTIGGLIRDASGAAIPGATIRIVNEVSGAVAEAISDGQGAYRTAALAPGRYRVDVTLDGFEAVARHTALAADQAAAVDVTLVPSKLTEAVIVTARRVEEVAQEVPIPLSVVDGKLANDAGAFNVNRLKELIPTVQFYSTNPRNSAINIRGLGAPFGLTNDGLEPGVGLYIDGVFYSRPASATLDFLDVERIEVLRGPQGTLFGKNTTAGAINVTTRKPTFNRSTDLELNLGDREFVQLKASVSGPLAKKLAGRASFSGTQRNGTVYNVKTATAVNDLDNLGVRGQLLFAPSDTLAITGSVDHTRQRPEGYTQVVAGVAPTLRPANRQYPQIAADLGYTAPSFNAFDRVTDVDTPLRSYQDLGGAAFNLDWKVIERHLRLGAARNLEVGLLRRRGNGPPRDDLRPLRPHFHRRRRELPLLVLFERDVFALPDRGRLFAAECARRLPEHQRLGADIVVEKSTGSELLRIADRGAR